MAGIRHVAVIGAARGEINLCLFSLYHHNKMPPYLAIIVIGRNEGERLRRCFQSLLDSGAGHIVYVDSGSTDGSVACAESFNVDVVLLDPAKPFTAARARNAGFDFIRSKVPETKYVQFVDGDCEVIGEWLQKALQALESNHGLAVVCGRRRERFPEVSIYNRLCDMEWDTPVGESKACGGDAMFRADAFEAVGGYNGDLIAGEEPELCFRLRQAGWKIARIDADMSLHDAAMLRFGQWWRRSMRSGYAYAEGAWLHGASPERYCVRETLRIWLWGFLLPVVCLLTAGVSAPAFLLFLIYPAQTARIASKRGWLYASFCTLGKFAEWTGQVRFLLRLLAGAEQTLIEYKQ